MNWVGGSRKRYMVRDDVKKQKEFFQKQRMQQKMQSLGLPLSSSTKEATPGSMDLVTLFMVNQISSKKLQKDPPKRTALSNSKRSKFTGNEPLELPMSPGPPSQLTLVESQPHYSIQERQRKHCLPQQYKCQQLSPVQESGFSDNSASDYRPHRTDKLSPCSTGSGSSGQHQGAFLLQQRNQTQAHRSHPPWETPEPAQNQFRPFSQPRDMNHSTAPCWPGGSNTPQFQADTPTVARVLFGSSEPHSTGVRDAGKHKVNFSLDQSEDKEPVLAFALNQSNAEEQFEEGLFACFGNEEFGPFGTDKPNMYLTQETPSTSSSTDTAMDSQYVDPESESFTQFSSCINVSLSRTGQLESETSPSYSASADGYLSSDSDGDEGGQTDSSHAEPDAPPTLRRQPATHRAEASDRAPNQRAEAFDRVSTHRAEASDRAPNQRAEASDRASTQRAEASDTASNQRAEGSGADSDRVSGSSQAQYRSFKPAGCLSCKKPESREAGTQTLDAPARQTSEASTQCSPPLLSGQTHTASTDREAFAPWRKTSGEPMASLLSVDGFKKLLQTEQTIPPETPFLYLETGASEERGTRDLGKNAPHLAGEEGERERGSVGGDDAISGEAETVQEIADILLMLRRRHKD